MNTIQKISIIIILALAAAGLWFWARPADDQGPLPDNGQISPASDFDQTGTIVINNPGLIPNTWYLLYDRPGAPALNVKLDFDDASRCIKDGISAACVTQSLAPGNKSRVLGINRNGAILVRQLTLIEEESAATRDILLYFYNPNTDKDAQGNIMCSRNGLAAVSRNIPATQTPIQDAIKLLLRGGLAESEKAAGITTEFPLAGVELNGANLKDGVLTLEFSDPQNRTGGGSCRAGILWFQIEATAKQFDGVSEVRFIPETLFQP